MDFINDITIKNSKLNFNVDPEAVDAGSVKVFNITGVKKVNENTGLTPTEFGALYIGRKDVANDCLVRGGNDIDIIFDANGVESDTPSSTGSKRNIKFITNGMGIMGSEINLKAATSVKIDGGRAGIALCSCSGSIISSAGKSNIIGANNSIDLVAYSCNGCTGHGSINFFTTRRSNWPANPDDLYNENGTMNGEYTEFPDVMFGKDKLTFSLPSQFNDSLSVGESKSGGAGCGNFCESFCESFSNNYGLYVDSTSFTYDNGTQTIDINPLCGTRIQNDNMSIRMSHRDINVDGVCNINIRNDGTFFTFSNSIVQNANSFDICSNCALSIRSPNEICIERHGLGYLVFDNNCNGSDYKIKLIHKFSCSTEPEKSGGLLFNSNCGSIHLSVGELCTCALYNDEKSYIHFDREDGIDIRTDKIVSISGSDDSTSQFVSDIPATFNKKAIFNDGICTKTITSIAGTPIFDTTDGKGFNFKGLYTLNGFGTTNTPFFKQESATNNWIDVTTLKEGGTALADKYALKTDIPADVDLSNYAQKATTLAGYGITDAYTKSEIDSKDTAFLTKESSGIQTVSSDLALTGYVLIDNLAIDELNIESLTASSKVTLSGGLDVTGGITVDGEEVATKSDISGFITKDVNNLTYYETKAVAEGKYALASSLSSYALKSDISNVYKYVGSVDTVSELPSNLTEADAGKVYNIVDASTSGDLSVSAGDNVAWTGTAWDKLGGSVDLSNYAEKSTTLAGYGITDAYTKSEIDLKDSGFLTKESSGIQTVSSDLALTGYVLIDNLAIDELNIESLTASSKVTLGGGLEVTGTMTVNGKDVATMDDIPDVSGIKTPIFKYFQNPVIPASCSLFAIATNAEFENMPMMQLVRNSDNKIVSADISWKSNTSGGHDIMVGIDHSAQINANTYTLQAFGY